MDTTIKAPNAGAYLLQQWIIKYNDKNNIGKLQNFMKSAKQNPQQDNRDRPPHVILDQLLYMLKQVKIIQVVQFFFLVLKEGTSFKLVIRFLLQPVCNFN